MNTSLIRPATLSDIAYLAPRLRKADVDELRAVSGKTPLAALTHCLSESGCCLVGDDGGDVWCIFGCGPTSSPGAGIVWMLGTDGLMKRKKEFLRRSRQVLTAFHSHFPILWNFVDERNTVHVNWLRWLGVRFIKRHARFGHEQRPFLEFVHHV